MEKSGNNPTVVDIFCGCGGLSEGFHQAGYNVLLGVDCDRWSIKTYNMHHQNRGRLKDVEDIDASFIFAETNMDQIDVLVGGPPCQAFRLYCCWKMGDHWVDLAPSITL